MSKKINKSNITHTHTHSRTGKKIQNKNGKERCAVAIQTLAQSMTSGSVYSAKS